MGALSFKDGKEENQPHALHAVTPEPLLFEAGMPTIMHLARKDRYRVVSASTPMAPTKGYILSCDVHRSRRPVKVAI